MRNFITLTIPLIYFVRTRLSAKQVVFSFVYEWFPQILLLVLACSSDLKAALIRFAGGSVAFMSVYELGYMQNDFQSVKKEASPRLRAAGLRPTTIILATGTITRCVTFLWLTYALGVQSSIAWYAFHAATLITFAAHNLLESASLRVGTFLGLAWFRFHGPLVATLNPDALRRVAPLALLFYVFFRGLAYMESKHLLRIPGGRTTRFKIAYYGFLTPASFAASLLYNDIAPVLSALYFFSFWVAIAGAERFLTLRMAES